MHVHLDSVGLPMSFENLGFCASIVSHPLSKVNGLLLCMLTLNFLHAFIDLADGRIAGKVEVIEERKPLSRLKPLGAKPAEALPPQGHVESPSGRQEGMRALDKGGGGIQEVAEEEEEELGDDEELIAGDGQPGAGMNSDEELMDYE